MSDVDREKWDRRYAEGSYQARTHPTRLLVEWLPRIDKPEGACALDLACGAGRNALYLAAQGYRVDAMDISGVALARGAARAAEMGVQVDWIETDLDDVSLTPDRYDLVVVARYVHRGLTEDLVAALRDGGHLLYEQHLQTDRDVGGPRNPEFRLRPNELLEMFRPLRVLYYREGVMKDPDGPTMALAQLVACRGSPGF
jgi:tellurite methyltransferase